MKKGIASVNGNSLPKVGETNFYEVGSFYPGTQVPSNNADIKWKLFAEKSDGNWRELRGPQKTGRRVPFNFPEQWYGKKLLIEAYLNSAEMKAPPGIIVMPVTGKRKIDGIGFFDSNWNPLSQTPKYGQTLNIRINTISMLGETLRVSLWERDTFSDTGHDPTENTNIWGSERTFKVQNPNGRVEFPLRLDPAWAILADKGMWDVEGSEHEFYLLVKGAGAQTKYSVQRSVKNEEIASQPSSTTNSQNNPKQTPNAPKPGANPSQPAGTTPQNSSSPSPTNAPTPTPTEQQEPIKVGGIGANPPVKNNGNSTSTVDLVITEGVTDAYFAKKEFSRLTGEEDGEHTYTFGGTKANNKTSTSAEKEKVANAILNNGKVNDTLKPNKKYTTKEAIVAALTANEYGKDSGDNKTVKFKTFKLGEEFKKIFSAPLEDKVYLVAKTFFLEGKTATITVKEKDGLIKGAADAVLPLSEISEAKMASTEALTEADRTEKTSFSGTIAKIETGKNDKGQAIISEMCIVPVQLRPKTDADLTAWKEKTTKGKKDADYTYTFGGTNNITTENGKKSVATAILKNIKTGNAKNTKLADGIVAYEDEVVAALQVKTYLVDNTITFSTYKKVTEMLWLNVKASGQKEYNKDFLKGEGKYFEIGGKCSCNRDLTESEFKDILKYLRESEKLEINDIWKPRYRGGSAPSDSSILSTLNILNKVMKKYDINSCIRRIYFIAECYHETDRFYSTQEYTSSHTSGYDPYRGRGIIQLTHKEAYERYAHYKGDGSIISNYAQIANNLDLAFDSAGWYFKRGKLLTVGDSWKPSSSAQSKYNLNSRSYPKENYDTKFSKDGKVIERYGSINLNLVADNDDINVISYLINGGDNGIDDRKKFVGELKKVPFFICDKTKANVVAGDWHDPVDNPISTNFYQNGNFDNVSKIWGLFGDQIRKEVGRKHTGLDLFAVKDKPVYACVDGTIFNRRWHTGYGNTITIKVKDPKALLALKRDDYLHKTNRELTNGSGWSENGEIYLFYAHLHSVKEFTFGQEVKSGQEIATTGRSGVTAGTCAPHLHFEIFSSYVMATGTSYRINPGYFVNYKFFDQQSDIEKNAQIIEKDKGQIKGVNGVKKLHERNLS